MARALKNPDIDPTYLDFFGMTRSPFAPLSAPSQIFHSEQYSLLMAHLASATKQADCLMIVCGADGAGKTTLLNRYITSLSDETSFATFDETCADGTEFYCAFLRQLGFTDITGKLQELRRITKEFLIHRGKAQDPVLLIMDNAHLVSPTVLEQLRWIAETKVNDRRVLSIVLAGNSDLPRIMDSPAMKLMKFRSHVDFTIRVFTEEETEDYVRHRLRLAGGVDAAKFSNDAHPLIYRFSGGIPDVINMLCNEVLTEACAKETRVITEELIRTVADKNRLEPSVVQLKGKGRRKTDPEFRLNISEQKKEERITARAAPGKGTGRNSKSAAGAGDTAVLKEHIARMQAQLAALKAENHQAQLDIGAYSRDIAGLHEQLAAKTKENEELNAEVGEVGELRKQLISKTQEIKVFGKAVSEIDVLREQLEAKTHQAEQAADAAALIDDLREQLDARTRQTEELGKTVGEINDLRKQLDVQTEENKALIEAAGEVDELKEQLDARTQEVEELGKGLAEIDDLKEQLDARTEEVEELGNVVAEIDSLREQLEAKTEENIALGKAAAEIDDLQEELNARTQEVEELGKTVAEIEDLKKQLEARTQEVEELEPAVAEIEDLKKQLAARAEDSDKLSSSACELAEVRKQLETKTQETQKLSGTISKNADEIEHLKNTLAESTTALKESEKAFKALTRDLKKEQSASRKASAAAKKAEKRVEKLDGVRTEMQQSVRELTADLKSTKKRAAASEPLEKDVQNLEQELKEKAELLEVRDERVTNLEKSLQEMTDERDSLLAGDDALQDLQESLSEKDTRIVILEAELASYSHLNTTTQRALDEEQAEVESVQTEDDADEAPLGPTITSIEIFREGQVEHVVSMSALPSRIMIGRGDDCEVHLDSKFVSRHHALIFCEDDGICVEDLNSFNGTLVNFKKITRCELHPDDIIVVGDYELRPS